MSKKVNKLSVYLIKNEFTDDAAILKDFDNLKSKSVPDVGTIYFSESHTNAPSWVEKFFDGTLDAENIFGASAKAVLMAEVLGPDKTKKIFAVPFGYGYAMLKPGTFEERFGLKMALNIVEPDKIRCIDKKNMSAVPKDTSEQLSRAGEVADFGIDIEQDLICSITGETKNKVFGRIVTGKTALSVSTKVDVTTLVDFLRDCAETYSKDKYKENFAFIDQIAEVKNPTLKSQLNEQLLENLKSSSLERTWLAVPEIVDWSDVAGFKYSDRSTDKTVDDIHVNGFLDSLTETSRTNLTIEILKNREIVCISSSSEEAISSWKVFNCIYCEVNLGSTDKTYLLSNGNWYEVEYEFSQQVFADYNELNVAGSSLTLPSYNHDNENHYNKSVAEKNTNFCCMDRKNISHGGGHSKIEFCDLLTSENQIVHVKRYGGSSVLSHLFMQGLVSGQLFLADKAFREKVNAKLSESHKLRDASIKPKAEDYEIVFAIISGSGKQLDLPFFSKVGLRSAVKRLKAFGYKVSLLKVSSDIHDKQTTLGKSSFAKTVEAPVAIRASNP